MMIINKTYRLNCPRCNKQVEVDVEFEKVNRADDPTDYYIKNAYSCSASKFQQCEWVSDGNECPIFEKVTY